MVWLAKSSCKSMKRILPIILITLSFSQIVFAQGDYKNLFIHHDLATNTVVTPTDFETIPGQIITTGLFSPRPFDISGIDNSNKANRIFLDNYITGTLNFKKAYLIDLFDNVNLDKEFKYIVNEVKYDGTGYVICGNINIKTPQISFNDAFILKVNLLGTYQWFNRYTIPSSGSACFNSIQPIMSGSSPSGYLACGYRIDGTSTKRAILVRVDTLGAVTVPVVEVNQPTIGGKYQASEYKKIILYANKDYALVGTCGLIKDTCDKNTQSNVLYSMYNTNLNSILGKEIGTMPFTNSDKRSDEGVSLVKCDSGVIVLSKYYNGDTLPCAQQPDYQGNLFNINPVNPTNPATWQLLKSVKFNMNPFNSTDLVRDLLFDASSGANMHTWVYGDYALNKGFLIKVNMNTATNVIVPKLMNNNPGGLQMECKTIDYNTSGNVVGLTALYQDKFSQFEIANSTNIICRSDSGHVSYVVDTLKWASISFDSIQAVKALLKHKDYNFTAADTFACDTVFARHQFIAQTDESGQGISIYPNPTNGILNVIILSNKTQILSASILDITGKKMTALCNNQIIKEGQNALTYSIHDFKAGIYFCQIVLDNKQYVFKVSKE